ncbi:arylsulfotransferase family protein [Streptomyces mirabilis]|uniref:arylsulfotransferase family protein n=1 Tax=Streptomyces mirabilis TaxID=68239 RepID=UPI0036E191EF
MVGQTGALVNDNSGDPVWFRPLPSTNLQNADFKVQTYYDGRGGRGQPVLTWWQGTLALPPAYTNLPAGAPEPGGCYYIYDSHYRLLKTVFAHHGHYPDEHEFTLTRRGTALFIASRPVPRDLTPYGGPKYGAIENSEIHEVDLATGRLLYSWNALATGAPARCRRRCRGRRASGDRLSATGSTPLAATDPPASRPRAGPGRPAALRGHSPWSAGRRRRADRHTTGRPESR